MEIHHATRSNYIYGRMETSSQRIETEAPITMYNKIGREQEERNHRQAQELCTMLTSRLQSMTLQEICEMEIGVVDISSFVDYGDGLSLPAEVGIARSKLGDLGTWSIYSAIPEILPQHRRVGYASDCKKSCEDCHGIDVLESRPSKLPLSEMCHDLVDEVQSKILLLCRSEDLDRVLGGWMWMRENSGATLRNVKVMKIEDFLISVLNRLNALTESNDAVPVFTQFTTLFSTSKNDFNWMYRCTYHNEEESAWDKSACSRKNVLKYLDIINDCLGDKLHPDVTEPLAESTSPQPQQAHCCASQQEYDMSSSDNPQDVSPSDELAEKRKSLEASPNRLLTPNDFAIPAKETKVPRRPYPQSFSARDKCSKKRAPQNSGSSASCSSSSPRPPLSAAEELQLLSIELSSSDTSSTSSEQNPLSNVQQVDETGTGICSTLAYAVNEGGGDGDGAVFDFAGPTNSYKETYTVHASVNGCKVMPNAEKPVFERSDDNKPSCSGVPAKTEMRISTISEPEQRELDSPQYPPGFGPVPMHRGELADFISISSIEYRVSETNTSEKRRKKRGRI